MSRNISYQHETTFTERSDKKFGEFFFSKNINSEKYDSIWVRYSTDGIDVDIQNKI